MGGMWVLSFMADSQARRLPAQPLPERDPVGHAKDRRVRPPAPRPSARKGTSRAPREAAVARRAGLPGLPDDDENCRWLTLTVSKSAHNFRGSAKRKVAIEPRLPGTRGTLVVPERNMP